MESAEFRSLPVEPIGYVRTAGRFKFDSPHQPDPNRDEVNTIELLPGRQFELALQDLDGFDKIWVLSWFDRNQHWRPRVMPPRGVAKRRGVFATRSPHRPNPIGLTCVSLLKIEGRILEVGPLDLVDGTPVLDIKPYLRTVDCFPDSSLGWVGAIEATEAADLPYTVEKSREAENQLAWLRETWGIDFSARAFAILRRDPTPHRTRRIVKMPDGRYRIACGAWRMFFRVEPGRVLVEEIGKGYSDESLTAPGFEKIIDREAQVAFAQFCRKGGD